MLGHIQQKLVERLVFAEFDTECRPTLHMQITQRTRKDCYWSTATTLDQHQSNIGSNCRVCRQSDVGEVMDFESSDFFCRNINFIHVATDGSLCISLRTKEDERR